LNGKAEEVVDVKITSSFKVECDGTYSYELIDFPIPIEIEKAIIESYPVYNLSVIIERSVMFFTFSKKFNATAEDNKARITIDVSKYPDPIRKGNFNIYIKGKGKSDTVTIEASIETKIKLDSRGRFEIEYDTSKLPLGDFYVRAGSTVFIAKIVEELPSPPIPTPIPTPTPESTPTSPLTETSTPVTTPTQTPPPISQNRLELNKTTPKHTPTPKPTPTPTPALEPTPTPIVTPKSTPTPTLELTSTPTPTNTPTPKPTPIVTLTPEQDYMSTPTLQNRTGKVHIPNSTPTEPTPKSTISIPEFEAINIILIWIIIIIAIRRNI